MSDAIRHTMPYEYPGAMEVAIGDAYIAAIARNAPHECRDHDCPGDINRRKLELWDELVAFLEREVDVANGCQECICDEMAVKDAVCDKCKDEILLSRAKAL